MKNPWLLILLSLPFSALAQTAEQSGVMLTVIGEITATPGLRCKTRQGGVYHPPGKGYEHFSMDSK